MSIKPDDFLKNPEQLKQMIGLLSSMLEQAETQDTEDTQSVDNSALKNKRSKKPQGSTINKFDQMPEASMYKENPKIVEKLYSKAPIKRRPKKSLVKVKCRICGKEENISSSLIHGGVDRYKCNKCSSSAG